LFYKKKKKSNLTTDNKISELEYINISNSKLIICIILTVITATIFIYNVLKLAKSYGGYDNYAEMMSNYRSNTSYGEDSLPKYVTRLYNIMLPVTYLLWYMFINNLLVDRTNRKNFVYLIPVFILLGTSLVNAERTTILNFFIYAITIFYLLFQKSKYYTKKAEHNFIFKVLVAIIIFLVGFVSIRTFVGRGDEMDPIYYITFYAGGSVQLLNLFLQNPIKADYFGEEVFLSFRQKLKKMGFNVEARDIVHLEFRESNGESIGNVYSAYRKYIHDFGYAGVAFFQILNALIFEIWYEKIQNRKIKKNIDLSVILFAYLFVHLCKHSITESIYVNLLNIPRLFLFLFIWKFYFINIKINKKKY